VAVYLSQSAVNCAIGNTLEHIQTGLSLPPTEPSRIKLGLAEDDAEIPYRAIEDYPLEQPNRLYQLLEDLLAPFIASLNLTEQQKSTTALFFGSTSYDVGHCVEAFQQNPEQLVEQLMPLSTLPEWICDKFQLGGLQHAYNSACSSSMNGLVHAKAMMEAGLIEHALVVGCELYNPLSINGFYSLQLLANANCQPFGEQDGMVLGEALAVGYLTKQKTAGALEIKAGMTQVDCANITCTQGNGSAISKLLNDMLQKNKNNIDAIKCHGVGTNNADQAELNGLHKTFGNDLPLIGFKPFIGNTLGAAGMVELALIHQLSQLHKLPQHCLQTPESIASLQGKSILINNFGFGGNNSCLWVKHHAE